MKYTGHYVHGKLWIFLKYSMEMKKLFRYLKVFYTFARVFRQTLVLFRKFIESFEVGTLLENLAP